MTKSLTIIRDPIHNYIPISQLEERLIADPLFLRLRYITQNALAHLVYPSNRTSRFVHSLGAMHIGGKMLTYGLANAAPSDLSNFWTGFAPVLNEAMSCVKTSRDKIIGHLRTSNDAFYREIGFDPTSPDNMEGIVLLQSLRIACVMHDLGHFPFSHTVEDALFDKYVQVKNQPIPSDEAQQFTAIMNNLLPQPVHSLRKGHLHEAIGRKLTNYIFCDFPEDAKSFATLCFSLAEQIARRDQTHPLLRCLHSIVSGHLDSDRCDYVRRDGYACGFEFGEFDLQRILATIRFKQRPPNTFRLLPTTVATSALESFFLERYRIFKWLVFHSMVVRANLALVRSVTILLEIALKELTGKPYEPIEKHLNEMGFKNLWTSLREERDYKTSVGEEKAYKKFAFCDEPWLLTLLRRIQIELNGGPQQLPLKLLALRVYLDLVCDRKKEYLRPVWKRQETYQEFCEIVFAQLQTSPQFSGEVASTSPGATHRVAVCNRIMERILKDDLEKGKVTTLRLLEEAIQQSLGARYAHIGIIADLLTFEPYETTHVLDTRNDKELELERVSTIVGNLTNMWSEEIRLCPFWWPRKKVDGNYEIVDGSPDEPSVEEFATAFVKALLSWHKQA